MLSRVFRVALVLASLIVLEQAPPSAGAAFAASNGAAAPASSYTTRIDNPWYPLSPGTVLTYQGQKDRKAADRVVTVTGKTGKIAGVSCVIVEDNLYFAGELAEKNIEYYAQDSAGSVWNFGEDAQEFENGKLAVRESWRAGVDGAQPALVMEASPVVGNSFVHEYSKNYFAVVSLGEPLRVPYGSFTDALVTKEWSPLERDILTQKYYLRGVGEARDVVVRGPKEEFVLVSVKRH